LDPIHTITRHDDYKYDVGIHLSRVLAEFPVRISHLCGL